MRSVLLVLVMLLPVTLGLAQTMPMPASAGAYSAAQASRGATLYSARCASCHGAGLQGSDAIPPLIGSQFGGNWKGGTVGDLAERIHTTMPMDNPGSLSTEEVAGITAYLLSKNGYPVGPTDLPSDLSLQRNVKMN